MFLRIKNIPKLSWSSKSPANFKPSLQTLFYLCLGLVFFGFGELVAVGGELGGSWRGVGWGVGG